MSEPIRSLQNERIKGLVRLRQRRERDKSKTFLVEGRREVERALEAGAKIDSLFLCPQLFSRDIRTLGSTAQRLGAELIELGVAAFNKASYRENPDGVLGVFQQFDTSLSTINLLGHPLLLVVEGIEKPGNLGTMMRTADAAGVTGVIVCDPATDPFNPNVVRASMGALFSVPLATASTAETLSLLRGSGIRTVATTPDTDTVIWDVDFRGAIAIVIGTEDTGLSPTWLENSGVQARLPMAGSADSLNAATAAAVCLFEAVRQRRDRYRQESS